MPNKPNFLDKVLARIGRLDKEGLQTVVQHLARERAFLERLFNAIEDGLLVVDESGRVVYFNQAVVHLLGLQPQAVEGRHINDFLPELDWVQLARLGGTRPRVSRHDFEVAFPRPRFLNLYVTPLDTEDAGSAGLALIIHDATEARQQTHAAIETERIHALTLLAASVAHEIGNPLNALHIHLQLIEREVNKLKHPPLPVSSTRSRRKPPELAPTPCDEAAPRIEKFLGVCKGEIIRLDYIVTQFLQAIRPSPPQLRPTLVNDLIHETIDLLRPEIDNRGIVVQERLDRHLPHAPVDPAQIKQALLNLIKNALHAMTRGGVLTLATELGAEGIYVTVADTGCGISQEDLTRIFEPFYTTRKKGTGLGLMIVQRIIREHGGRIELNSHVGQGTSFRIWLPLQERPTRLLQAGQPG